MDETSGLIRRAHLTAARVQDVEMLEACTVGDEAAVYAERGDEGRARTRCHSRVANTGDLIASATVYNLRRACLIVAP